MRQNLRKPAKNFTRFTQGCVKIYVGLRRLGKNLRRFTQVYAGRVKIYADLRCVNCVNFIYAGLRRIYAASTHNFNVTCLVFYIFWKIQIFLFIFLFLQ